MKAVQKVSDLWPWKIHLHTWRSATPIPFRSSLLVTEHTSLSRSAIVWRISGMPLLCRVPYNVASWLESIHFQMHFQMGEEPKITRSHVERVGSLSYHSNFVSDQEGLYQFARNQLVRCYDAGATFPLSTVPVSCMAKSSVRSECTEPLLILTSYSSSLTVTWRSCMTEVRTWSLSSSFQLVEGLRERASLSTGRAAIFESVVPLHNLYDDHLIIAENQPNLPKDFHLAISKLLGKFHSIPLRVVPEFLQKITMRRELLMHSNSHGGCTRLRLSDSAEKSTYVHEGSLHLPTTAHLPCFISSRGKKSRQILYEQPSYST
jgi:hypothetical protein